mmetsp:Transcript_53835/g.125531  ORF Transcript_53835/g.125531 Transcript_53835/m.125531 type:complete len:267 (+) Transcript_53835:87-887(+)
MMASESDLEQLLESPQRPRSISLRPVAAVVGGLSVIALGLLVHTPSNLRIRVGGFLGLEEEDDEVSSTCLEMGVYYADPHKMENTERTVEIMAEACQQRCFNTPGCEHFTFWPDGGCLLTDVSSTAKAAPYKYSDTISGPAHCGKLPSGTELPQPLADKDDDVADTDDASGAAVKATVLPGVNGTTCAAYPACVAVGISQGSCCPNEEQVSLGCCNGFPPPVVELKIAAGSECSAFPACAEMGMTGACCPAADGMRLSCCDEVSTI